MNSFIQITKHTDPKTNFWDLNPHLILVRPFSKLYSIDSSKDHIDSSKHMWCIVWMSEPDEDENRYYRLPELDRLEVCKEFNPDFDIEDPIINECIAMYPEVCLTTEARAYKQAKDFLQKRSQFLKQADYSFETMAALDNAIARTPKILEDFSKVEKEYLNSKNSNSRIYGQRQKTARERNLIQAPEDD